MFIFDILMPAILLFYCYMVQYLSCHETRVHPSIAVEASKYLTKKKILYVID